MKKVIYSVVIALMVTINLAGQEEVAKDTTNVKKASKEKSDDSLLLNAESNSKPRDINTGLPANTTGMYIYENNLPMVFYSWPEMPYTVWTADATLNSFSMITLSDMAIKNGDVGNAVACVDNLGTDKFQLRGSLSSSHFGLMKGTFNTSAPIGNKGFQFSVGGFVNRDPRTIDLGFTNYAERSNSFKVALTKRFNNGKGYISAMYKYNDYWGTYNYALFKYKENGKIEALDNFDIGHDSYMPGDGQFYWKNPLTGEGKMYDLDNAGKTTANSFYVLGQYNFNDNLELDYNLYYHAAKAGMAYMYPTLSYEGSYTYLNGEAYEGNTAQLMFASLIDAVPTYHTMGNVELKGKNDKHQWTIGLNEWHYKVDNFNAQTALYYQSQEAKPSKLIMEGSGADQYGNMSYNSSTEYHDGMENKVMLYLMDSWNVTNRFTLNAGVNFTAHHIKGNYSLEDRGVADYLTDFTNFDYDWFYKKGTISGYYRIYKNFGASAKLVYNEERGHLENFGGTVAPGLKKVQTPMAQAGVYLNGKKVNLVSSLTTIKKTNYQIRKTLYNDDASESVFKTIYYDVQTLGWTTDVNFNLFKNFSLHYLLTLQNPVYKNFSFDTEWSDGSSDYYDYSDNTVTEVPKVLMEIDPSYSFLDNKARVWVSARYYSKQYENIGNAIYFAPHWETFGGVNYNVNKNLDFACSVTNILNQKGAKGSISGADLVTPDQADQYYDEIIGGTYILPFTVKFDLSFHF